jgi:hypothetical protein
LNLIALINNSFLDIDYVTFSPKLKLGDWAERPYCKKTQKLYNEVRRTFFIA